MSAEPEAIPFTSPLHPSYRQDLPDGLVLRWMDRATELKKVCEFAATYGAQEREGGAYISFIFHKLKRIFRIGKETPLLRTPYDCAIIEDTTKEDRPIIACAVLYQHELHYDSVSLNVGRPEFVLTDYRYRNRGLQRAVHDLLHAKCEARGDALTIIGGIKYFYKQFGYDYAVEMGGGFTTNVDAIPKLKGGEIESIEIVDAQPDDAHFFAEFQERRQRKQRNLLWGPTTEEYWRWHLTMWHDDPENDHIRALRLVRHVPSGVVVGWLHTAVKRTGRAFRIFDAELDLDNVPGGDQLSVIAVMSSLLRALRAVGQGDDGAELPPFVQFDWNVGAQCVVKDALERIGQLEGLAERRRYAWYVRVPNYVGFLRRITPVLEARIAESTTFASYTGEVVINMYRSHIKMVLEGGKIKSVEAGKGGADGSNAFSVPPDGTFNRLLFGYKSLGELMDYNPDVDIGSEKIKGLIELLFPKRVSSIFSWF
ncbi:hypothetical protein BC937DRAFT_92097 [Endogone sp. FLAS-F59071]|nr:hypothetical protein BC937DRAFT_92097 [Endogone sp. FLAS-F59071]|eukprot:RUS21616.1 hypothetical protein BC937DRAFT_92097 [Endogone sp. FLAS-F59071]